MTEDFFFNFRNHKKARGLSNYRSFLPSFFYPDWRGGYIAPNGYWYSKGVLSDQENKLRHNINDDWVFVIYNQSTQLPGYDTRNTTSRTLLFKVKKLDEMKIRRILAVAQAYSSYLGIKLSYKVNKSNSLSNINFLRLQLEVMRYK